MALWRWRRRCAVGHDRRRKPPQCVRTTAELRGAGKHTVLSVHNTSWTGLQRLGSALQGPETWHECRSRRRRSIQRPAPRWTLSLSKLQARIQILRIMTAIPSGGEVRFRHMKDHHHPPPFLIISRPDQRALGDPAPTPVSGVRMTTAITQCIMEPAHTRAPSPVKREDRKSTRMNSSHWE